MVALRKLRMVLLNSLSVDWRNADQSSMAMPPPPPSFLPFGGLRRTNRRATGDLGVQRTNDDAQAAKVSCAALGYFKDDLLPLLAKCLPSRKSPLINRGTWARHAAMRQVTTDFVTACLQNSQRTQQHEQQQCQLNSTGAATVAAQQSSTAGSACLSSSSSSSQVACQVVVLGAGSDSSWFNLQQQRWPLLQAVHFIELDYHEMVSKKARTILSTTQLLHLLPDGTTASTTPVAAAAAATTPLADDNSGYATWTKQSAAAPDSTQQHCVSVLQQADVETGQCVGDPGGAAAASPGGSTAPYGRVPPPAVANHVQELSGQQYSLVGADLRYTQQFESALERAGFEAKLPTLYLSECVLIYMEPKEVQGLLAVAAQKAVQAGSSAAVAVYEQTRPDDAFGVTMVSNLEARGCPLRSLSSVPTPASQRQRLLSTGWTAAAAADMAAVYYGSSSGNGNMASKAAVGGAQADNGAAGWLRSHWQAERQRIEQLELLDELEEWKLLQAHYCLAIGVAGEGASSWLAEGLQLQQLNELCS